MNHITFTISGEPFGKRRPRAHVIAGHARVHDDPANQLYELKVQNAFRQAYPDMPCIDKEEAIEIRIYAHFEIPKSFSKKKTQAALNNEIHPTKRPDVDNVAKSCMDALSKGVAFYDDAQVVALSVYKSYDAIPKTIIQISTIKETEHNESI